MNANNSRPKVNMPAVVGVVVVSLAAVIVWVVTGQMSPNQTPSSSTTVASITPPTSAATTTPPSSTTTTTTSVPSTTTTTTTSPATTTTTDSTTTTSKTTTTKANTTGGSSGGSGDLGIPGRPIQSPTCDGAFVTIVASAVGADVDAAAVKALLDRYPDSNYLRTDRSCASFAQNANGQPIYVVYLGPFAQPGDACLARSKGPAGSYVRRLSMDADAGGADCS